SSGEYLRSQAHRRNVMSCTLMAALSLESCLAPLTPALALAFPFPLPLTGAMGSGVTVPSALRTPQAGPVGAGRTGGAWATRLARSAARSSLAGAGLGGSATGGGPGAAAGGWEVGRGARFVGIGSGG